MANYVCIYLYLHPYKVHLMQQLKPGDEKWVFEQQAVDGNFSKKIFFSDEVLFIFDGYVNKQNCRIWGSGNPQ